MQTGARRVPPRHPPVPICPEFRAGVQTRRRCVPAQSIARTRGARVSCGRANSRPMCTEAQRRLYSWGASLRRPCKLTAGVYRGTTPPILVRSEFTDPLQTRRGCVPGLRPRPHAPGATLRKLANSARVRTRGTGVPAHTRGDLARSCELGPGVLRPGGRRGRNPAVCDAVMVKRFMAQASYLRSCVIEPSAGVSHPGDSRITRSTPATSWHGVPLCATHRGRACVFAQTGAGCVRRRVRTRHDLAGSRELGPGAYPRPPAPGRYSFTCTWGRSAYPWKSPMYTK